MIEGMTLRDYLAAKAMRIAYEFWSKDYYNKLHPDAEVRSDPADVFDFSDGEQELIAELAYEMADAMLKAREK